MTGSPRRTGPKDSFADIAVESDRPGAMFGDMFDRLSARELGRPSSWVGRFILGPLWNRRNRALNDVALQRLTLSADDRVLEIGFGPGYLIGLIASRVERGRIAGIDASAAMVGYARRGHRSLVRAGRLDLRCGAVESLPFASNSFTQVVSVNSIFYWTDPGAAFAEMGRVLTEDGRVVLVFTDKGSLERRGFSRHGLNLVKPAEVAGMLEEIGFEVSEASQHVDTHRHFWCIVARRRSR